MIKQKKLPLVVENVDKLVFKALSIVKRQVRYLLRNRHDYSGLIQKCAQEI